MEIYLDTKYKGGLIMAYITLEEYTALGGTVTDSTSFALLEKKARRKLDYFTQDRLKTATTIIDEVKEVMTEFINKLSSASDGEKVSSFSHDGVSVSFDNTSSLDDDLYNLAVEYLPIELISTKVGD